TGKTLKTRESSNLLRVCHTCYSIRHLSVHKLLIVRNKEPKVWETKVLPWECTCFRQQSCSRPRPRASVCTRVSSGTFDFSQLQPIPASFFDASTWTISRSRHKGTT